MWRTRSNPLKNTQYIDRSDYHSIGSEDSDETIEDDNMITARFMNTNNDITDKTIRLDVRDIISWPCLGNCGYSRAECYLSRHCCQDWYCPSGYSLKTYDCPSGMFRIKKGIKPEPCSNCGSQLKLYSPKDAKTMSIIENYTK